MRTRGHRRAGVATWRIEPNHRLFGSLTNQHRFARHEQSRSLLSVAIDRRSRLIARKPGQTRVLPAANTHHLPSRWSGRVVRPAGAFVLVKASAHRRPRQMTAESPGTEGGYDDTQDG